MKKTLFVRLAILLLTTSALSGCIWWVDDNGGRRGDSYERDRGGHHGERHEDRGDRR